MLQGCALRVPDAFSNCRPDQVTDLDEVGAAAQDGRDPGAAQQAQQDAEEAASAFLRREGEAAAAYAGRIFRRVFQEDIESVLRMEARAPCLLCLIWRMFPSPCMHPSESAALRC